jgi:hypothetical protein
VDVVADAAAFAVEDSDAEDLVAQDLDLDLDVQDAQVVSALVVSDLVSVLYKKNVPLLVLRRGIPIFSVEVNVRYSTVL